MESERLLTANQVAEILGIHPRTVKRWIESGKLHGVWLGSDRVGWRIRKSEVDLLIAGGGQHTHQIEMPQETNAPKLAA